MSALNGAFKVLFRRLVGRTPNLNRGWLVRSDRSRARSHWITSPNRGYVTSTMPGLIQSLMSCVSSPEVRLPDEGLVMKTVDCDWMKLTNQKAHHTNEYENPATILRRGQTFKVKASFQRAFNDSADKVYLDFAIGNNPQVVNDTRVRIPLSKTLNPAKWSMVITDTDETTNSITVEVSIPPNAIIGRYKTVVEFVSKLDSGEVSTSRDKEPDIIILFNPWSKDDAVYMDSEDMRNEYVLNDTGEIYRGSSWRISPKKWNFGQFEEHILDTVLGLLDNDKRTTANSGKWLQKRRDPVWVCRALSTMCSAANKGGVLEGNWSGNYEGGFSPLSWNGSVKIFQEFHATNKPVQYGQCWVFSAVMTTALRALGIPTRSITNFASAHDTEGSMTIDKYVTEEGKEIEGLGGDSVWNFHVWNESWMDRTDLPNGYDGWQVVDATPQEISLGLYQTGPAPLTAIKKGEVYLGYETPFVFAEVNSDRVTWIVKKVQGAYEIQSVGKRYPKSVGKNISTKKVGVEEREDVTNEYKFKEGSDEERAAFRLAYGFGSQPEYQKGFLELQKEETTDGLDIEFTTNPVDAELYNGDEFTVKIALKNQGSEPRTVNLTTSLHSTTYTGVSKAFVKRLKFEGVALEPNATASKEMKLVYNDYGGKLVDQNSLRLVAVASVKETKKLFSEDYEFRLENKADTITIKSDENLKVGKKSNVTMIFTNPMPIKLTHVTFTLEGAGLSNPITHKIGDAIPPGEKAESVFSITPKRPGVSRLLIADVDSRQVQDFKKHLHVEVNAADPKPAEEPPAHAGAAAEEPKPADGQ